MTTATVAAPRIVEPEQRIVLNSISWDQYEAVLRAFPEQGGLRIIYIDGRLTLLSPKLRHDWHEHAIGRLVEAVADGLGVEWQPAGHTTYRRKDVEGGVEGDQTYYFGENAETMRGAVDVDLAAQPPPDLAIEVELTHSADDSVSVWGRLGVPEVWRLNVDRGTLSFGVRQADGTYSLVSRSAAFPELGPDDVLAQLRLADQMIMSRWARQIDEWVRNVIVARRGE